MSGAGVAPGIHKIAEAFSGTSENCYLSDYFLPTGKKKYKEKRRSYRSIQLPYRNLTAKIQKKIKNTIGILLCLFLEQLEQRTVVHDFSGINQLDVQKVFAVRKQLLENLTNVPPLKQLSLETGMSISKLQKCFQQVFGKSISQYALSGKMNLVKQLLDSKKYSVSEVGYQLGYSNLSHFSKAFNNEFGINPKAYSYK